MGKRLEIKPGDRYGRWLVIQEQGKRNRSRLFFCKCDCGNRKVVALGDLRNGHSKSCGCLRSEVTREKDTTHGLSGTKLYQTWCNMKKRCFYPAYHGYHNYGGRGIKICDMWLDFESFRDWAIASGYQEGLTIERIDNDAGYEPRNCTWIPQSEQPLNSRHNRMITYKGQTKHLAQWARALGFKRGTLLSRLNGWSTERAFSEPIHATGRQNHC